MNRAHRIRTNLRWVLTLAMCATASGLVQAQTDEPKATDSGIELAEPSAFKELSRFGLSATAAAADVNPKPPLADAPVNQKRINSIHERIALIKRLIDQEKQEAARKADANSLEHRLKTTQPDPATVDPDGQSAESPTADAGAESAIDGSTQDTPIKQTVPAINVSLSGTPVMSQPINPFELANSLFVTGNIAAARRSYESGLADASVEDRLWLKCLIGCCYRLEGDYPSAETTFREVTSHKKFAYPVDYARWCLKYLEQRRNSVEQFQVIDSELENLLTEMRKNDGA